MQNPAIVTLNDVKNFRPGLLHTFSEITSLADT